MWRDPSGSRSGRLALTSGGDFLGLKGSFMCALRVVDAPACNLEVSRLDLDADEPAAELRAGDAGGAAAHVGVDHSRGHAGLFDASAPERRRFLGGVHAVSLLVVAGT